MRVLILIFSITSIGSFGQTLDENDINALKSIYNGTNGDDWTNSWDLGGDPASWHGVVWTNGRVASLDLGENNLTGNFPTALAELPMLKTLILQGNQLNGSIPSSLGNLSNLINMDFHFNELSGEIPEELGNITTLWFLDLSHNELSGTIPSTLGNLSDLLILELNGNKLSGEIPPQLGSLSKLTKFEAVNNMLTGGIPSELGNLVSLEYLELGGNLLTGEIPSELGTLSFLKSLFIGGNLFSGEIPPELGTLYNLTSLWLSNNKLSGEIPVELTALTQLTSLQLHENELAGSLPYEISNLTNLISLNVRSNKLSSLPEINNPDLQSLIVYDNKLGFDSIEPNVHLMDIEDYRPQGLIEVNTYDPVEIGGSVTLSFATAGNNNQYQWFKDGFAISEVSSVLEYEIEAFTAEDIGTYKCMITNQNVDGLILETEEILLDAILGVDVDQQIRIFPNPSSHFLYLEINPTSYISKISILSLDGKIIERNAKYTQGIIEIESLETGIYLLLLETEKGNIFLKFIKE